MKQLSSASVTCLNLLERHHELVRRELERSGGREVKTLGDGVRSLGTEVRAGLHTGECEIVGDDVAGLAVHIASRVVGQARAGDVLVSSTVKDLVTGAGVGFDDRGVHELKGIPGDWGVFTVRA